MFICFLRQGFSVALETVLKLALWTRLTTNSQRLPLPPSAGIKGVHHLHPAEESTSEVKSYTNMKCL